MYTHNIISVPTEKNYCLGIDAIKEYGLERWQDEFFMPFSVEDCDKMLEIICGALKKMSLSGISQESMDIVCILYTALTKYGYFLYRYLGLTVTT